MVTSTYRLRVSAVVGASAALAVLAPLAAAAPASLQVVPGAAAGPPRCFAVNVVGRTVQQATALLRARRCTPGFTQDGRHYLVIKACRPMADFGRVFAQSARNRRLGPRERLIVRVGIRTTADGRICGQLNPNPGPPPSPSDYDGSYDATFTVTTSSTVLAKPGQQLSGLTFTARNGNLAGAVAGNVDASGQSPNAAANLLGLNCQVRLNFALDGDAITVSGDATCESGNVKITGTLKGQRTGP